MAPGQKLYMREVHFVMAVGPGEGRTMSELARILEVTRGAVSQLAARMEKKGYICRVKAAEDKRRTLTCLTEQGRALYREHLAYDRANYQQVSQLLGDFSNEELERIRDYERRVRACFTGQEDEP